MLSTGSRHYLCTSPGHDIQELQQGRLLAFGALQAQQSGKRVSLAVTADLQLLVLATHASNVSTTMPLPPSALGRLDYSHPGRGFLVDGPYLVAEATRRRADSNTTTTAGQTERLIVIQCLRSSKAFAQSVACYALQETETLSGATSLPSSPGSSTAAGAVLLHISDSAAGGAEQWILHLLTELGGTSLAPLPRPAPAIGPGITAAAGVRLSSTGILLVTAGVDGVLEARACGSAFEGAGSTIDGGALLVSSILSLPAGLRVSSLQILLADAPPSTPDPEPQAHDMVVDAPSATTAAFLIVPRGTLLVYAAPVTSADPSLEGVLYLLSLRDLTPLYEIRGVTGFTAGSFLHPLSTQILLSCKSSKADQKPLVAPHIPGQPDADQSFALLTLPGDDEAAWAVGPFSPAPVSARSNTAVKWQALSPHMGAVSLPALVKRLAKGGAAGKGKEAASRKRKANETEPIPPHDGAPAADTTAPNPTLESALLRQLALSQGDLQRAHAAVLRARARLDAVRGGLGEGLGPGLGAVCSGHRLLLGANGSNYHVADLTFRPPSSAPATHVSIANTSNIPGGLRVVALHHRALSEASNPPSASSSRQPEKAVRISALVLNDSRAPALGLRLGVVSVNAKAANAVSSSGLQSQSRSSAVSVVMPGQSAWVSISVSSSCGDVAICLRYSDVSVDAGVTDTMLFDARLAMSPALNLAPTFAATNLAARRGEVGRLLGVVRLGTCPESMGGRGDSCTRISTRAPIATGNTVSVGRARARARGRDEEAAMQAALLVLVDEMRAVAVAYRCQRAAAAAAWGRGTAAITASATRRGGGGGGGASLAADAASKIVLTPSLSASPDVAAAVLIRRVRSDLAVACALNEIA